MSLALILSLLAITVSALTVALTIATSRRIRGLEQELDDGEAL